MKLLNTYYVADNTDRLELEKMVESMIKIGYERIGDVMEKKVPETHMVIYMQVLGQFKEMMA